jgi:hypothetical protein
VTQVSYDGITTAQVIKKQEVNVKEIREKCSEPRSRGQGSKLCDGSSSVNGIEANQGWTREVSWTREPTPETVKRLIEWFSDERN